MTSEYHRGYQDGLKQAALEAVMLGSEDRSAYEFVGGPLNGQVKPTQGKDRIVTLIPPDPYDLRASYIDRYWMVSTSPTIVTGTYVRKEIISDRGRRRTVYVWQGPDR